MIRTWVAGCVLVTVAACGSGSSSGSSNGPATNAPPQTTAPEISSVVPSNISLSLSAGDTSTVAVSFSNTGDADLTYQMASAETWISLPNNASGSVVANGSANLLVDVTCGDVDLNGSLQLTTNDADEGLTNIAVAVTCEPLVTDLAIARVTFNQAARAFDSNNGNTPEIGFVAEREMLIRAFVTGSGQTPDARVIINRTGSADLVFDMVSPPSIGPNPASESSLQLSHYVIVPGAAITSDARVRIEVAPFSNPVQYPSDGSGIALDPVDAGVFEVTFVPVTFEGQTPTLDGATYIRQALEVLPIGAVDIEIRTPYTFTGTFDLDDLLMEISDLRNLDGSDRLYHAVIIPPSGGSSTTAGVGFVGFPVSVSVDLGGAAYIIAHEMGHNLNLRHAPGCDAPDADSDYPNSDAAVTTWGYNVESNELVEPTATKRDFMSYCRDIWVSDYHFDRAIAFRNQNPTANSASTSLGLSIRGRLNSGQISDVQVMPTRTVTMAKRSPGSEAEYTFVAWDINGTELINHTFSLYEIVDEGAGEGFVFSVPKPPSSINHYEIRHLDSVVHNARMPSNPSSPLAQEVAVQWDDLGARLTWINQGEQALVVKNVRGEVIAVDRTGSFTVQAAETLSIDFVQADISMSAQSISAGVDQRVELLR